MSKTPKQQLQIAIGMLVGECLPNPKTGLYDFGTFFKKHNSLIDQYVAEVIGENVPLSSENGTVDIWRGYNMAKTDMRKVAGL